MKKLIFTLILPCLVLLSVKAQVMVSGSTGADNTYATLKAAFDAINSNTDQSGKTIVITITADVTETASAVLNQPTNAWNSLTIYPTGSSHTISGAISGLPLIDLNGADKVYIDGRVGAIGSTIGLTISNTSTSATNTSTIRFYNDACNNSVSYCTILGSATNATSTASGTIFFGAATATGNDNILIDHNNISHAGADVNRPIYSIYSYSGSTTNTNSEVTISNNNIYDVLKHGSNSMAIFLAGDYSDNWTISNNSFYETTSFTPSANGITHQCIRIYRGDNFTISNNYIGGSGPLCSGTWIKTDGGATKRTVLFKAIYIEASGVASNIDGNIIKNFNWTDGDAAVVSVWRGIEVNAGTVNIGTMSGNIIGSETETGSITVTAATTASVVQAIYLNSPAINCQNNIIGSITGSNTSTLATDVYGIYKNAQNGSTTIINNTIGSEISNSIQSTSLSTANTQNVVGIYMAGTGTNTITRNLIRNISNSSPTGVVAGINLAATTSGSSTCSNNIIVLSNSISITLYGINEVAKTTATNIYHNTIYLSGSPTVGSYNSIGINSLSTANNRNIKNNLIFNNRANSGATGKNYAISLATYASGTFTCDYNNLFVATDATYNFVGNYGGSDKQSFADWKASLANLDANSENNNPNFALTNPLLSDAYYPGNSNLTTTNVIGTVTTDYAGTTRHASTPTIGALEYGKAVYDGIAWNIGSAPSSASTDAALTGNYSGAGFTCKNLTVNPGKQFSLTSGTLSIDANMTLKSDAANGTATFIDNGGTLSVGANKTFVEQYLTSSRNWYISSPVSAATSNVFAASVAKPMYYYVETTPNAWSQIINTSTNLDAKKGYIANINSERVVTFTGGNLNTGEQTIGSLTGSAETFTGFNLVGNPYPSYLSWSGATRTNVGTSIWYKSKSTGAYVLQTYNSAGGGATNGGTNLIPPMQAFWVKVTAGQTGSIVFDNDDRAHNDQSVSTNRLKAPSQDTRKAVRLQVSNGINADEALIYADDNALDTYDTYDSNKMFNNNAAVPEIYTVIGTEKLAINGFNNLSDNQTIALGFKTTAANTFTIKATELKNLPANTKLILVDKSENNAETDLTEGAVYSFTSDEENSASRFSIQFRVSGSTTNLAEATALDAQVFVNSNNQLTIIAPEKCNYKVYNAVGQLIENGILNYRLQTVNSKLNSGVFVVRLSHKGQDYSARVIIK